jgi:hypothetical protein
MASTVMARRAWDELELAGTADSPFLFELPKIKRKTQPQVADHVSLSRTITDK